MCFALKQGICVSYVRGCAQLSLWLRASDNISRRGQALQARWREAWSPPLVLKTQALCSTLM